MNDLGGLNNYQITNFDVIVMTQKILRKSFAALIPSLLLKVVFTLVRFMLYASSFHFILNIFS